MKHKIALLFCFIALVAQANELLFLDNLNRALSLDECTLISLAEQVKAPFPSCAIQSTQEIPLFVAYPDLQKNIPYISLGSFPTPIQKCKELESVYGIHNLFVKQDSISGGMDEEGMQLFGGNKVRKLEFLLADALHHHAESVVTFGCMGSNHAVATATYAKNLGLRCYLMLTPQSDSPVVQRNLALMNAADAHIIFARNRAHRADNTVEIFERNKAEHGDYPYFIPTGGSTAVGVVGFVNAAFELRDQINKGLLPTPDYIYVAAGSFGTVAGLSLGLKAAGIASRIVAVAIEPAEFLDEVQHRVSALFEETNQLLHDSDATFPLLANDLSNIVVVQDFCGKGYGLCTQEAYDAMDVAEKYEDIYLDGTYTGKTFAALLDHAEQGLLQDKNVLFWNTFCAEV